MQGVGFEPTRALSHWILSPAPWTRLGHPCKLQSGSSFKRLTIITNVEKLTHVVFAVFIFSIIIYLFKVSYVGLIFILIGSVFPDFDLKFYHRKLLHNFWIIGIVSAFLFYFHLYGLMFLIGALSHLFLDSLTPTGIFPFWPVRYKFKINSGIKTGSLRETIFLFLIGTSSVILLAKKYDWNIKLSVGIFGILLIYMGIRRKIRI